MSYPILYETNATDFFNLGLGTLPDAISPLVTEERNGEFVFDMSYPIDGRRADLIKNNRIIKVDAGHLLKDQRFVIKTVTPQMDNSGKTFLMIHAEHVSYLANDLAIKPIVNGIDVNASQALSIWNSNLTTPNQFTVDSDINSKNSFSWSIDKVQNGRQALGGVEGSILDHWHGEYRFDNLHISLLQHRGTTANTLLAYGRNLTTFEQEESILEAYTSVYPYALLTPAGSDSESKIYTIDGLIIDSTHAANFPNRKVLPVDFSSQFENVKVGTKPSGDDADKTSTYLSLAQVQSKLKEFTQSYITTNNVGVPKVSIKVSFVDLANTVNYSDVAPLEELDLCDEVPIRFSKLGIDTTAKVSRVVWNVLTDSYDSIELGEISATLGDKLTEIEQTVNKAQDTADKANIVQVGADGKSTIFRGSDTPIANHVGDLWYKPNGEYMEMYQWDGVAWHFVMSTKDTHDISDKVDQAMKEMADKEQEINDKLANQQVTVDQAKAEMEQAQKDADKELAEFKQQIGQDVSEAKTDIKQAVDKVNDVDEKATQALANATEAKETTQSFQTDVDYVKGQLELTATVDDIDAVNRAVKNQQLAITANSDALKLKAESSVVDQLKGTVDADSVLLAQTAKGLEGKADTEQLNKLSGDLTSLSNDFTATSAGFNASLSKIDDKVDNIQVGGRNYLIKDTLVGSTNIDDATGELVSTNATWTTTDWIPVNSDTEYTWQAPDWHHVQRIYEYDSNKGFIKLDQSSWNQFIYTIKTQPNTKYVRISIQVSLGAILNNSNQLYKFELGNKATDWTPAPEDMATNSALQVAKADIKATADELHANYTKTTDMNTYVSTKIQETAGKFDVSIAAINDQLDNANDRLTQLTVADGQIKGLIQDKANTTYVDAQISGVTSLVGNNKDDTDGKFTKLQQNLDGFNAVVADKADIAEFSIFKNQVNLRVDNIQIGGRNLIPNTYTENSYHKGWGIKKEISHFETGIEYTESVIVSNGNNSSGGSPSVAMGNTIADKDGNYLTIDGKVTNNNFCQLTEWYIGQPEKRFIATFKLPSNTATLIVVIGTVDVNTAFNYREWQLEKGNKATDWSPSPEDMVNKDNLVSQINIDQSGVLIQGKKIWITGQTTIDNAVIKSAMIDTIDASKITAGVLDAANVNIINLNVSKLVGDTTNFVQSAWNGINGNLLYVDADGIFVLGDNSAILLGQTGMRSFANVPSGNLEVVGNFSSAHIVDSPYINGTMVSIEPDGDFVGFGHRESYSDPFDLAFTYWRSSGAGYQKGINSNEDIYINASKTLYVKKLSAIDYATRTYLELATSSMNGYNYPGIFSQGLGAGLFFGSSETYLSSKGSAYNLSGTIKGFSALHGKTICIPTDIVSGSGAVNTYVKITLS